VTETAPRIYQESPAAKETAISGRFKVSGNAYTFELAKLDENADLIIDPTIVISKARVGRKDGQGTLLYSSYLGGSQRDFGNAIAVDSAGNAYVAGQTASSDFPTTPGAFQTSAPGGSAFVTKVNALGSQMVYSTYLGIAAQGFGIAVDSSGNAYASGGYAYTFPTTSNAFSQSCYGSAFLTKLTPAGDSLIYSTCLGLSPYTGTTAFAVAVDQTGNAYLTGQTGDGLPTTANAFQSAFTGCSSGVYPNAFFSVLNPSLSGSASLTYSTYLGAQGVECQAVTWGDSGLRITVDAFSMAYITGYTSGPTFPVTSGAYLTAFPASSCSDGCILAGYLPSAFIAKFDPQASGVSSLIYSTFLGGSLGASGNGISVDALGNAYVAGGTGYYWGSGGGSTPFPTTSKAYQTRFDGQDAFLTKLNAAGNGLVYSTLLGGARVTSNTQGADSVGLDASGQAVVSGATSAIDFPTTPDAFQTTDPSPYAYAAFVTKFDSTGSSLVYSSFLGGSASAEGKSIAVDSVGDAYVTGFTNAIDFPISSFAFQPYYAGNYDAFVTKFPIGTTDGISITGIVPNTGGNAGQVTPEIVGTGFHFGATTQFNCGSSQVPGKGVIIGVDGRTLQATFDLTSLLPGSCDVVVTNPDKTTAKLSQGFTVQDGGSADVRLAIAQTGAVPGLNSTYIITASNVGNIDLQDFSIENFIEPWFAYQTANPLPSEIVEGPVGWPEDLVGSGQTYPMFLNWNIPTLPAHFSLPVSGIATLSPTFPIHTLVNQRACPNRHPRDRYCEGEKQICIANAEFNCRLSRDYLTCMQFALTECDAEYKDCLKSKEDNYVSQEQPQGGGAGFDDCGSSTTEAKTGNDPNDLNGSIGVGSQQWVAGATPLGYVLEFSNDGDAAVQRVVTTNPLNTTLVVPTTLRLATMTVVGYQVPIPPTFAPQAGLDQFDTNLDLRPAQNLFVQIHVSLDPNTGLITWVFQSIDPKTGQPPTDPTVGFLNPGQSVSLFFAVNPVPGLSTGTQVTDQGTVVFDANPPQNTNIWLNTIDNTPPTSQVLPLPPGELCPSFTVQWTGSDIGSGIGSYTIYASDDGAPFAAWLTNTASTSGTFNGQVGHTYGFYSIATDLVGNIEPSKSQAETSTYVVKSTGCGPVGPPTVLGGRHK
jgi:hypothetical protein